MSFFKRRWSRKLQLELEGEEEVVFTPSDDNGEASCSIRVKVSSGHSEEVDLTEVGRDMSDGDLTDQEVGDEKSLIPSEEDIDSDGVVREYEVALKHLGFGFFHVFLLFINGMALLSDAIEVLSISFVLRVLRDPEEYGAGDAEEAILSSIIFVGMLFGSYIWGGLADIIGRRTTIVCSLTLSAVFGFASALSPWFWLFVLLRFFSGFGVGGSLPVIFPYTSEFIRNKYRGPYLGVQSTFWMFGRLLCGGFAWAIIPVSIDLPLGNFRFHSWRLFIAISALPSLIGAFLYFLLPESPRYLLEVGKQEKAMKGLRLAYKLNHLGQGKEYPVKRIVLENTMSGLFISGKEGKLKLALERCKEVLRRTLELFKREYWRRTPLLLVIMFCLSFGSYGVTLWYPTYVAGITAQNNLDNFERHCKDTVNQTSDDLRTYCDCSQTVFVDIDLTDSELNNFRVNDVLFKNVSFSNVNFDSVVFNGTQFIDCQFYGSNFTRSSFNSTVFDNVLFDSVNISSSSLCSMNGSAVEIQDSSMILEEVNVNGNGVDHKSYNSSTFNEQVLNQDAYKNCSESNRLKKIKCKPPNTRVYRDSFFVSASAFPGNIASAFAVYFFRRNYWMSFVLFLSTISVFLLYVATSELFVVIMLCIFTAVSTPAWNDSSLLIAELYPTHLRSTAAGVHLLMARIGAIIGTNIFGAFINVNPSVPILFVAVVLFICSVAALGLPKTTRKTLLK